MTMLAKHGDKFSGELPSSNIFSGLDMKDFDGGHFLATLMKVFTFDVGTVTFMILEMLAPERIPFVMKDIANLLFDLLGLPKTAEEAGAKADEMERSINARRPANLPRYTN